MRNLYTSNKIQSICSCFVNFFLRGHGKVYKEYQKSYVYGETFTPSMKIYQSLWIHGTSTDGLNIHTNTSQYPKLIQLHKDKTKTIFFLEVREGKTEKRREGRKKRGEERQGEREGGKEEGSEGRGRERKRGRGVR